MDLRFMAMLNQAKIPNRQNAIDPIALGKALVRSRTTAVAHGRSAQGYGYCAVRYGGDDLRRFESGESSAALSVAPSPDARRHRQANVGATVKRRRLNTHW